MRMLPKVQCCSSLGFCLGAGDVAVENHGWALRWGGAMAGSTGSGARLPGFPSAALRSHSDPLFSETGNRDDGDVLGI